MTAFFASGWDRLQALDLCDSTITAQIGAVRLPGLKQLDIKQLPDENTSTQTMSNHLSAFVGGCPQCTWLRFTHPSGGQVISCCKDFPQLVSVAAVIPPVFNTDWEQWPLPAPRIELPASVTTLTCGSDPSWDDGIHSDLYAVLSMVASNLEAGVGIKELHCSMCAAYAGEFEDELGDEDCREPSEAELEDYYKPVSRALHGLESSDVTFSPWCGERAVAEVVAAAPDLRALATPVVARSILDIDDEAPRAFVSPTLTTVTVHSHFFRAYDTEQGGLEVDLSGCRSLDTCVVKLEESPVVGDRVAVMLECYEGADIKTRARKPTEYSDYWELRCTVCNANALHAESSLRPVRRRVTVAFKWSAPHRWGVRKWRSKVRWSE
jgi:hypothetical protein